MGCDRDKSHRKFSSQVSVTRDRTYGHNCTVRYMYIGGIQTGCPQCIGGILES